jgi:hypothetical protein
MNALLALMVTFSVAAIALGLVGRRRIGSGALLGELVMVVAMLDVHSSGGGILATPIWASVLALCAITTACLDRVRRARSRVRTGDALHPIGMLLGATLLLFVGAAPGEGASGGHVHLVAAVDLVIVVLAGLLVYAVLVLRDAVLRHRRDSSLAREVAGLGALFAMAAMVALG